MFTLTPITPRADPTGSGISPDLAYRCDPVLNLCVLAKDPPSSSGKNDM